MIYPMSSIQEAYHTGVAYSINSTGGLPLTIHRVKIE